MTHAPLELVHVDLTSMESTMELNKPPSIKNVLVIMDHFMCYTLAVITKNQMAKTVVRVLYKRFIMVFSAPAKLFSDWGANFTFALVIGKLRSDKKSAVGATPARAVPGV